MTPDPRLDDPDPQVRLEAVSDLPLDLDRPAPDHPNVRALIRALDDPDAEVRDWATFGLGVQLDVDSPEIREALFRMLGDTEADTAGEAAVGLARRKDPRVYERVLAELSRRPGNLWVEAAAELADQRLVPVLLRLKADGWDDGPDLLAEAIEACAGRN
ncbi:MAG TPA: HEAT repeat domain-containing protein [Frankiaceae bacterium]|nr:HEAT repeat domain-containing protein [Frankiaceae bacterium]